MGRLDQEGIRGKRCIEEVGSSAPVGGCECCRQVCCHCCWDVRASSGARWMKFRHSFYKNACTWLTACGRVMGAPEFVELHDCI